jgi:ribonuclease D
MKIKLHHDDLPADVDLGNLVAIDTETMGLKPHRDRLCLVQLSAGDGVCHLVQIKAYEEAVNLKRLLADPLVTKIYHFARFDVAILYHTLKVISTPNYCTKIASRLVRTYTDKHGLKDLCKDILKTEISKQEQTSDWGAQDLTPEQMRYAATDVLHLHALKAKLDELLQREGQEALAQACFSFIPYRAQLDLIAGDEFDIFQH